jgi:hypothetical protein
MRFSPRRSLPSISPNPARSHPFARRNWFSRLSSESTKAHIRCGTCVGRLVVAHHRRPSGAHAAADHSSLCPSPGRPLARRDREGRANSWRERGVTCHAWCDVKNGTRPDHTRKGLVQDRRTGSDHDAVSPRATGSSPETTERQPAGPVSKRCGIAAQQGNAATWNSALIAFADKIASMTGVFVKRMAAATAFVDKNDTDHSQDYHRFGRFDPSNLPARNRRGVHRRRTRKRQRRSHCVGFPSRHASRCSHYRPPWFARWMPTHFRDGDGGSGDDSSRCNRQYGQSLSR